MDGILKVGVLFAFLTTLTSYSLKYGFTRPDWQSLSLLNMVIEFVFKAVCFGAATTFITWNTNEDRYEEYEENNRESQSKQIG